MTASHAKLTRDFEAGSEVPKKMKKSIYTPVSSQSRIFTANFTCDGTGAFVSSNMSKFDEWFKDSGFPESERGHLETAFNYALALGMKFGMEEVK